MNFSKLLKIYGSQKQGCKIKEYFRENKSEPSPQE